MPTTTDYLKNIQAVLTSTKDNLNVVQNAIGVLETQVQLALQSEAGTTPPPVVEPPKPTDPKPLPQPSGIKFRWNPADGTHSPARQQIEPQGGRNTIVPVTKDGKKWLEFRAIDFSQGTTAKCGLEYNNYYACREGDTVRFSYESEFDDFETVKDLFICDLESNDSRSIGLRFKLRADGLIVFSGDKIGAGILNGKGKVTTPGRTVITVKFADDPSGWATVEHNDVVVGDWKNVKTMGGANPTKLQCGPTANSTGKPIIMRMRQLEHIVY